MENEPVVKNSDVIFVAVKPGIVPNVLQEVKTLASGKLFVSVAMGVTIKQIESVSGFDKNSLLIKNLFVKKYIHNYRRFHKTLG